MKPADQRRVVDVTEVQVFGVKEIMGLIDAQTERGRYRQPDKSEKGD
jgi:hypothetical protein